MTYIAQETSVDNGAPVELYTIRYEHNAWYYVNSDEKIVHESKEFLPLAIDRSDVKTNPSEPFGELEVDVPLSTPVLDLFRVTPPSGSVTIICERKHLTDPDGEGSIFFKGEIVNVEAELTYGRLLCHSTGYSINRIGLRQHYQRECPHMLYGSGCGINRDLHKVSGPIAAIAGNTVDVYECVNGEDDLYAGGYIEYTHKSLGTIERLAISASIGATGKLTLFSHPSGVDVNTTVDVFIGCDRTFSTCRDKFSNAENFGGLPFIPTKNPFTDNPTY